MHREHHRHAAGTGLHCGKQARKAGSVIHIGGAVQRQFFLLTPVPEPPVPEPAAGAMRQFGLAGLLARAEPPGLRCWAWP